MHARVIKRVLKFLLQLALSFDLEEDKRAEALDLLEEIDTATEDFLADRR